MCSTLCSRMVVIFSVCPLVDRWWQLFYYKAHMLFWGFMLFFISSKFSRWHQLHQIQSWASPSYHALFLQTLTTLWPQTTRLLRRSVPRTTLWSSILRGRPLSHIHTWRRKVLPSPSTRSSTYPCFSSTVRCPSALRCLGRIQTFHQYVVSFLYSLLLFWIF